MLNCIVLAGNLGADPEIRYSNDGKPIASFNLAFRSGKEKTGWIKITAFNHLAEISAQYLHKGARIAVVGSLDHEKWQTSEGENRSGYKLIAHSIEFIKVNGENIDDDLPF